jgi:two-component system response regulator AlgR
MPLKLLLVDDEPLARLRLRTLLHDCAEPATEIVGEAGDAATALALLREQPCDLLLLDIGLPGRDGLQLAAALRAMARPPAVVFVTAHAEHALRAFELDAVDYLTKPVARARLRSALQRVAQRSRPAASAATAGAAAAVPVLVVSDRGRMLRIPLPEVLYLKAELKYVTLRTADHAYVLDDALADLEQRLGESFVRIHRNALVAKAAVRALQRRVMPAADGGSADAAVETWAVRVAPLDEWLAVSRRQLGAVRDALRR